MKRAETKVVGTAPLAQRDIFGDNIYNVGFTVRGLTEEIGVFMPVTRKFNWTKSMVRWNLQRVANGGRSFNGAFNKSYNV